MLNLADCSCEEKKIFTSSWFPSPFYVSTISIKIKSFRVTIREANITIKSKGTPTLLLTKLYMIEYTSFVRAERGRR
jgi:hypothetical protein